MFEMRRVLLNFAQHLRVASHAFSDNATVARPQLNEAMALLQANVAVAAGDFDGTSDALSSTIDLIATPRVAIAIA